MMAQDNPAPVYWVGAPVDVCDMCAQPFRNTFVDGVPRDGGSQARFDLRCHRIYGLGRGRMYRRQPDGRWLKVEG